MTITNDTIIARLGRPSTASESFEGTVVLVPGQSLKLETSPGGEELLELTAPAGATWTLLVRVDILKESS